MAAGGVHVAVVGLGFGAEFVPFYQRIEAPDRQDLLPHSSARYTQSFVYHSQHAHLSFKQGGGHHGSHPHRVHEFVRSIVARRQPWIDAVTAANWTAAAICAHESAMKGGAAVEIPSFDR